MPLGPRATEYHDIPCHCGKAEEIARLEGELKRLRVEMEAKCRLLSLKARR